VCTPREVQKYQKKASGPILDRIDLHVNVPAVEIEELSQDRRASRFLESSENVRKRVEKARKIQQKRFEKELIHTNAEMKNHHVKKYCVLTGEVEHILSQAAMTFRLSARSYFKMIKIARTIADLEGSLEIAPSHMAETLQYRQKIYDEL
jgi:magnesium chelatase family protein